MQTYGWILLAIGSLIGTAGIGLLFASRISWLGRLPGDVRIEGENFRFYFPLVTCLLLSLIVSVVLSILRGWSR
ncbi:MAG: DUF2905 domain-containing protein [Blastopirellula sp. JB062]